MGRPKLPTAVKLLQGTLQKCRTNPDEPTPEVAVPETPDLSHLSETAQRLWPEFAAILYEMRVLTTVDGPGLTQLVQAFAEGVDARQAIKDAGGPTYSVTSREGNTVWRVRPEVAIAADADRRFLAWSIQFGLTPAARSKVSTQFETPAYNEFEDI